MEPLESIHAALLAERARLLDEIGEAIVTPGQMTYGSQAAAASQVFAQQRDLALRDRAESQLVLVDEALTRGVISYSSGNHAQGVARAARLLGVPAVIVMPSDAPAIKRDRVAADGAQIVTVGTASDERQQVA